MISLSALTFMRLVLFYSDTQVRLTGHNSSFAGRVEVFAHGVWGRVLHSWPPKWGQKEAAVVCRQLGFPGVITALRYSSFGEGSGPVLMSNVQCTGNEKTIQQCQYKDWVDSNVANGLEVGVICKTHDFDPVVREIPIRLQGSSVPNAGLVEVLYAGIWGAISENNWDIDDARVACRQLGYQTGAEAALKNRVYGPVSGPVWLTNLQCSGSETNLMSCAHDVIGNKSELQRRQYAAGVICKYGSLPSGMSVRLRGSYLPNIGRVEVNYAGKWSSIRASNWDINDAIVVCRQLGYSTASLSGYGLFCSAAVPHWFTNFRCYGNESSLHQCARDFLTYSLYGHCASVVCKNRMTDSVISGKSLLIPGFELRLGGSPVPHAGRVELRHKGIWGTIAYADYICDHYHFLCPDPELLRVICRQLNFTDGILSTGWSVFGPGTGPKWLESWDIQCSGNENNILNCSHQKPRLRSNHYSDLSVVCKPPGVSQSSDFSVRLNGSSLPFVGTIEVMYQGVWGSVLGAGHVDINVGHVVCHQLGYPGADKMFQYAVFGKVKGPLWIWSIQCIGNETEISHCEVITWDEDIHSRYYSYYQRPWYAAGVLCHEVYSSPSKSLSVRLAGAPINNAGRVEVSYAGVWVTVYCLGWDINDGHVVCRQLGYPGAISSGNSNQFGVGAGTVWFENVRCLGNESNFGECPKDVSGNPNSNCLATVQCKLPYQSDLSPNCFNVKCANNGTCIDTAVGAVCNCTDGFTGLHCEIHYSTKCFKVKCANKGTCIDTAVGAVCSCTDGFTGLHCEIPTDPCHSRPCPENTSCHDNETHYFCVTNEIQGPNIDDNGSSLKISGKSSTEQDIFDTPFIVLLSVSATVIVLLTAALVYLIFRNRRRTKHPPSNQGAVFSNMAYKDDPENNLGEGESNHSNDVDLGTGTTQTQRGKNPVAIYEEASRPLPPIPIPHNAARKEGAGKKDLRTASSRANIAPASVPRASEEHYMGLTRKNENNTAPTVPTRSGAGTYSSNYMSLSPAGRPGDIKYTSYSSPNSSSFQNSGAKQRGNKKGRKRRKESHENCENTGK